MMLKHHVIEFSLDIRIKHMLIKKKECIRGLIKGWAPDKLTGCEDDFTAWFNH